MKTKIFILSLFFLVVTKGWGQKTPIKIFDDVVADNTKNCRGNCCDRHYKVEFVDTDPTGEGYKFVWSSSVGGNCSKVSTQPSCENWFTQCGVYPVTVEVYRGMEETKGNTTGRLEIIDRKVYINIVNTVGECSTVRIEYNGKVDIQTVCNSTEFYLPDDGSDVSISIMNKTDTLNWGLQVPKKEVPKDTISYKPGYLKPYRGANISNTFVQGEDIRIKARWDNGEASGVKTVNLYIDNEKQPKSWNVDSTVLYTFTIPSNYKNLKAGEIKKIKIKLYSPDTKQDGKDTIIIIAGRTLWKNGSRREIKPTGEDMLLDCDTLPQGDLMELPFRGRNYGVTSNSYQNDKQLHWQWDIEFSQGTITLNPKENIRLLVLKALPNYTMDTSYADIMLDIDFGRSMHFYQAPVSFSTPEVLSEIDSSTFHVLNSGQKIDSRDYSGGTSESKIPETGIQKVSTENNTYAYELKTTGRHGIGIYTEETKMGRIFYDFPDATTCLGLDVSENYAMVIEQNNNTGAVSIVILSKADNWAKVASLSITEAIKGYTVSGNQIFISTATGTQVWKYNSGFLVITARISDTGKVNAYGDYALVGGILYHRTNETTWSQVQNTFPFNENSKISGDYIAEPTSDGKINIYEKYGVEDWRLIETVDGGDGFDITNSVLTVTKGSEVKIYTLQRPDLKLHVPKKVTVYSQVHQTGSLKILLTPFTTPTANYTLEFRSVYSNSYEDSVYFATGKHTYQDIFWCDKSPRINSDGTQEITLNFKVDEICTRKAILAVLIDGQLHAYVEITGISKLQKPILTYFPESNSVGVSSTNKCDVSLIDVQLHSGYGYNLSPNSTYPLNFENIGDSYRLEVYAYDDSGNISDISSLFFHNNDCGNIPSKGDSIESGRFRIYRSNSLINISNFVVKAGGGLIISADSVLFGSDFKVEEGSILHAFIGDCNNWNQRIRGKSLVIDSVYLPREELKKEFPLTFSESPQLRVYPNPTSSWLTVAVNGTTNKIEHIEVLDTQGKSLFKRNCYNSTIEHIDFTNFPPSLYMLRVISCEKVFIQKVIRQ